MKSCLGFALILAASLATAGRASAKGTVSWHELPPGQYYPGTPHHYAVYVPSQLPADRPAPFMVFLDGTGAIQRLHVPAVFDRLIARGELPPMIGVFVDPGILPARSEASQNRYERIFEYDSLSDRYSKFLLEELLPAVARLHPLSPRADDHGICGVSTGAIGAFVAAWRRPDEFHRVLTLIGTFVDMKGAEELASLVRKTEPKPIRVFMQDGRNDHIVPGQPWGISFSGSWPINNQVMHEALKFAGYDARLVMGDGAHDTQQGAQILPEALRWLWSGYPRPVTVREPAAMKQPGYEPRGRVYTLVSADAPWQPLAADFQSIGGLAADPHGNVYVSDPAAGRIWQVNPQGKAALYIDHSPGASAMAVGPDGRLYVSQPARRRIVSYGSLMKESVVVSIDIEADAMAMNAMGGFYFVDAADRAIGYLDDRRNPRILMPVEEMETPAGLALAPDQAMLLVSDGRNRHGWSFQIAKDGRIANGEPFYRFYVPEMARASAMADVATDVIGQGYFAGPLGIQVTEQNGRVEAVLNGPNYGPVSHLAFGGPGQGWIYASSGQGLFRRRVKIAGAAPWAPLKPPQPPL